MMFQIPESRYMLVNREHNDSVVMVGSSHDMEEHAERLNMQYQTNAYVVRPYPTNVDPLGFPTPERRGA